MISTHAAVALSGSLLLAACDGGSSRTSAAEPDPTSELARAPAQGVAVGTGIELPKPGGGTFFLDPNQGGNATTLHLAEMSWGRLVDVHTGISRPRRSPS